MDTTSNNRQSRIDALKRKRSQFQRGKSSAMGANRGANSTRRARNSGPIPAVASTEPFDVGSPQRHCKYCGACFWDLERSKGELCHRIGSLLRIEGYIPKFAQLYMYDTTNELQHRLNAFEDDNTNNKPREDIVADLMMMLHANNIYVRAFCNFHE